MLQVFTKLKLDTFYFYDKKYPIRQRTQSLKKFVSETQFGPIYIFFMLV
jgi:hypothetical protein